MRVPTTVGTKGQVVIEKRIRDRLGVKPGATAVQALVGDRVEIRFVPPPHSRSVFGVLAPQVRRDVSDREWGAVRQEAWERAARDQEAAGGSGPAGRGRTRSARRGKRPRT
jgi:AbrB family looped-hinge helix DNA binding protein